MPHLHCHQVVQFVTMRLAQMLKMTRQKWKWRKQAIWSWQKVSKWQWQDRKMKRSDQRLPLYSFLGFHSIGFQELPFCWTHLLLLYFSPRCSRIYILFFILSQTFFHIWSAPNYHKFVHESKLLAPPKLSTPINSLKLLSLF